MYKTEVAKYKRHTERQQSMENYRKKEAQLHMVAQQSEREIEALYELIRKKERELDVMYETLQLIGMRKADIYYADLVEGPHDIGYKKELQKREQGYHQNRGR